MKKLLLLAVFVGSATLLASCGGGGDGDTAQVAAADAKLAVDGTNGKPVFTALSGESFSFPAGVADFGTATATTVTIVEPAADGANPKFTVTSGGDTASGVMAFGSCIFRVTASTFDPPSPLADGEVIEIANCGVQLDTAGQHADGVAIESSAVLFLNNANSTGTTVTVGISPSGKIVLNGKAVGTVTLRPLTGAF